MTAVSSSAGLLRISPQTHWSATAEVVDMASAPPAPRPLRLAAAPQDVVVDLNRTAIVVIDMQNDFCAPEGGWLAHIGVQLWRRRAQPIAPLNEAAAGAARGRRCRWSGSTGATGLTWLNLQPERCCMCITRAGPVWGWATRCRAAAIRCCRTRLLGSGGGGRTGTGCPSDVWVDKYRMSGFWDTPLDSILRNLGIRSILFAGCNTDQCVLHTLTDANFLGYGCVMLEDCCATSSPAFCTEATVWNVKKCFGFVTGSDEVIAALGA